MRWRVDFRGLPGWARYGLAAVVLAAVVGIVLLVEPDATPAGWYTALVRIGAVALLLVLLCWLVWRAARLVRRR